VLQPALQGGGFRQRTGLLERGDRRPRFLDGLGVAVALLDAATEKSGVCLLHTQLSDNPWMRVGDLNSGAATSERFLLVTVAV